VIGAPPSDEGGSHWTRAVLSVNGSSVALRGVLGGVELVFNEYGAITGGEAISVDDEPELEIIDERDEDNEEEAGEVNAVTRTAYRLPGISPVISAVNGNPPDRTSSTSTRAKVPLKEPPVAITFGLRAFPSSSTLVATRSIGTSPAFNGDENVTVNRTPWLCSGGTSRWTRSVLEMVREPITPRARSFSVTFDGVSVM
jgi:hypothetical protein